MTVGYGVAYPVCNKRRGERLLVCRNATPAATAAVTVWQILQVFLFLHYQEQGRPMKRFSAITAGLLVVAFTLFGCNHLQPPFGRVAFGPEWVTLIDGDKGMENFTRLGDANWLAMHGAIQADRKNGNSKEAGILLSKNSYTDFEIYAEFWANEDANSGIYIRVMNQKVVNTKAVYEVQIWDKSPAMATASLMPPAKAAPTFKAAGKWNTFEITAKGPRMTVTMNGEQAVDVNDTAFSSGPIALQYNSGTVKFRKLMIRPL